MIGSNHLNTYYRMKAGKLPPTRVVTFDEFVKAMMATGATEEKAKMHANLSCVMESAALVGEEMLRVAAPAAKGADGR